MAERAVKSFELHIAQEDNLVCIADSCDAVTMFQGEAYHLEALYGYDGFEGDYDYTAISHSFYNAVCNEFKEKVPEAIAIKHTTHSFFADRTFELEGLGLPDERD